MSLYLNFNQTLEIIKNKRTNISKSNFNIILNNLFNITEKIIDFMKNKSVTGFENDLSIGINSESFGITTGQGTNPLLWTLGHICYFYEFHFFKYIINNYKFYINNCDLYDSFVTDRPSRFNFKAHSKKEIFKYYNYVKTTTYNLLNTSTFNNEFKYLLLLSILHNHMHCESIIFTKKLLGFDNTFNNNKITKTNLNFPFIEIKKGTFIQGNLNGENLIAFDNEMPQFNKHINNFIVSKFCVTEKIVCQFINDDGYSKKELWCNNGWKWLTDNNISLPYYWIKKNNDFYINDYNILRPISDNFPISHISWYEACAIAKWMGGRLPTESEWEYLATNCGKTKFPWGNIMDNNIANLNYSGSVCSVDCFSDGDNHNGVRQLFGNVWEWCMEPLYPYNGFTIDPVYREFSYPFFGFKKILRGGCWAVPDILINSRYRNAQMPDCRIQFTGFRVVKDY